MKIWLADLTYTQQSIASDVVPAAIGMIAEYAEKKIPSLKTIKIIKYPEDLSSSLNNEVPDLIGFSHYMWNSSLSDAYGKRIKEVYPKVIIVAGGPNFPTVENEQEEYLKLRPWIDFYLVKEGEHAFTELVKALMDNNDPKKFSELPNLVYRKNNIFFSHKKIERIMDLTEIPSPYLSHRLDNFLDGKLLPVTQTNRGCPFTCTFCTEGQSYWTKVRRKPREIVKGEISYISEKMNSLKNNMARVDLLIADSNFGMFEEDLDTCRAIAAEQKKTGYPKYINVATGKNKKERVLEAASIVNGAMKLAGSVQSLDPEVQDNIKRKNISSDQIVDMALKSSEIGANTYSEVILALPGDTKARHFKTLQTLVESSFTFISMYQLMMLPGTELGSQETKSKYKMETKFRVVPRWYGTHKILGKDISVSEIEEICTSHNTLSFDDYLECRKMNLIINIFYNDGVFEELIFLLKKLNISIWDWIKVIYQNSTNKNFLKFNNLLSDYLHDTENELWPNYNDLRNFCNKKENIDKFIKGELGSNLVFKYKSRSLTIDLEHVAKIAEKSTIEIISSKVGGQHDLFEFVNNLIKFKQCQIDKIFDLKINVSSSFSFDIPKFIKDKFEKNEKINLNKYKFKNKKNFTFSLNNEQKQEIENYNKLFGNKLDGISRTLSRIYIKKIFRSLDKDRSKVLTEFKDNKSRRWGGGLESI